MSNKITPEALIELGFEEKNKSQYVFRVKSRDIWFDTHLKKVYIGVAPTNATTIEDIKDLIRLFK